MSRSRDIWSNSSINGVALVFKVWFHGLGFMVYCIGSSRWVLVNVYGWGLVFIEGCATSMNYLGFKV